MIGKEAVEAKLAILQQEKSDLEQSIQELRKNVEESHQAIQSKIDYINVYNGGIEALKQLLQEDGEESVDNSGRGESSIEAETQQAVSTSDEQPASQDS